MQVDPHQLGELERTVLDHLWRAHRGDAKEVHQAIGTGRGITLNTIQSTLKRLFEKGLLAREKVSHAHVYRPRMTREEFHRGLLHDVVRDLMRGKGETFVAAFVDVAERAGPEHLARLEALVAERRRSRERGSR